MELIETVYAHHKGSGHGQSGGGGGGPGGGNGNGNGNGNNIPEIDGGDLYLVILVIFCFFLFVKKLNMHKK